jgi:hypothetical protein
MPEWIPREHKFQENTNKKRKTMHDMIEELKNI